MILNNKIVSLIKKKINSSKIEKLSNNNLEVFGNFKNGELNEIGFIKKKGLPIEIGFFKKNKLLGKTLKIYTDAKNREFNNISYIGEKNSRDIAHGEGTSNFSKYFVCNGNWNCGFAHGECIINLYGMGVLRGIWKYGKLIKTLNTFENTSYINNFEILSDNMQWDESINSQKKVMEYIKDISKIS